MSGHLSHPLPFPPGINDATTASFQPPPSNVNLKTKPKAQVPTWASLATGATSGLASSLLLQPMDLLKTRMQQESRRVAANAGSISTIDARRSEEQKLEGRTQRLRRIIRQVWSEDGPRGFWRGTAPTVVRNVPGVALYFYSVSELRAIVATRQVPYLSLPPPSPIGDASSSNSNSTLARLSVPGNLLTGALARVSVGLLLSPATVIKAKMESSNVYSKSSYPSLGTSLRHLLQTQGVRGLYQGFGATAIRDAPYAGIYVALYEQCKVVLGAVAQKSAAAAEKAGIAAGTITAGSRSGGATDLAWVTSVSGLLAGTLATLLTHPFDIVKTRIQTQAEVPLDTATTSGTSRGKTRRPPVRSTLAMARQILAHDGPHAFLDGLGLRCARKAVSSAIGWSIFEMGSRAILKRVESREEIKQLQLRDDARAEGR